MNQKTFYAILQLRRDNDYNYRKVQDKFIPANGELCLVDTVNEGLRVVCGDGKSVFRQLPFIDNIFIRAYYHEGQFYEDNEFLNPTKNSLNKIYIDITSQHIYVFNGKNFQNITYTLPLATDTQIGGIKLYNSIGSATDGTMSQAAITKELNKKIEMQVDTERETLYLKYHI